MKKAICILVGFLAKGSKIFATPVDSMFYGAFGKVNSCSRYAELKNP
jgi:hypothetical protein